jgi:uncharacterized protein with HEPN domain
MKEFAEYLVDILDRIELIESIQTQGKAFFETNRNAQAATERHLEIIGEIIKRLPLNIKNNYADIPWRRITGLRDKLAHHYDEIDLEVLWSTVTNSLPDLKVVIQNMLDTSEDTSNE